MARVSRLAIALLFVCACGGVPPTTRFVASGVSRAATVAVAREIRAADASRLFAAGATVVGTLLLESTDGASANARRLAAVDAARAGGTHLRAVGVLPQQVARRIEGPDLEAQLRLQAAYPPGQSATTPERTITSRDEVVVYEVYAVLRARWPELPTALRP